MDLIRDERVLQRLPAIDLLPGDCLIINGQNGAGKSTLLSCIAGLLSNVQIQVSLPVRLLGHKSGLIAELSVMENLKLLYALDLKAKPSNADLITLRGQIGLIEHRDLMIDRLSAGQKRRLQLSRLWVNQMTPCLWLLDEPLTALDKGFHQALISRLDQLLALGHCLVITSHQPMQLCSPVAKLSFGDLGKQAQLSDIHMQLSC